MTRRLSMPVWLILALVGCLLGSAEAARPESLEVRDRGASRGLLTITVMDDGSAYIAPDHLAALLKGAWAVKGEHGTLTVGQPRGRVHAWSDARHRTGPGRRARPTPAGERAGVAGLP